MRAKNTSEYAIDFDDKKAIFSILMAGTVVAAIFLLLPLYVGVLTYTLGFSEEDLGVLVSMDLIGSALMSITAPVWIRRIQWRYAVRVALIWLMVCNLVSIYITDFWLLALIRFFSSIGFGLIGVIVVTASSYTRNPDRFIALLVVLQVSLQVVGFRIMPGIIESFGIAGFFYTLNVLLGIGLLTSVHFPAAARLQNSSGAAKAEQDKTKKPAIILLSFIFFFIAQVGLFSFIERLGADAGFSTQDIGSALSLAVLIGLAGAVLGAAIASKWGRFLPLMFAGVCQIGSFYLLAGSITYQYFLIATALIQFFWNLPLGQQVGVLVKADSSHRWIVFVAFAQAVGVTIAPALSGFVLKLGGYNRLLLMVCVAMVIYLLLILPFAYSQDRQSRAVMKSI